MKKWTLLDQSTTPDGSAMTLHEHDGTYYIRINGLELMSTRRFASEERLAELACAHLARKAGARVLIGGLGFGFTLRAALKVLPPTAEVIVVELMEAVITWNEDERYPLAAEVLKDPRVQLVQGEVGQEIMRRPGSFDAVMLDVDNGADALTTGGNQRLYQADGLMQARAALRRGGCVAYWSAASEPIFTKQMGKAGFDVTVERVRSHVTSGGWHTILIGRVP